MVEDSLGTIRVRERSSGASYLSSCDPRILVGLGTADGSIRKATIRWPSGKTTIHEDLGVDRYWRVEASTSEASPVRQ